VNDPQFLPLITGAIAGALMKESAPHGPFLIDVEVETDKEGNYTNQILVTGRESGDELLVTVKPLEGEPPGPSSAMRDMSRAIRKQLEVYGSTLRDIPLITLKEQTQIVGAFYLDMKAQVEEREEDA
jgi:hypothetical protein